MVLRLIPLLLLASCATAPEKPAQELRTYDEGDRVCVLVNPELIYCQPVAKPETIEI